MAYAGKPFCTAKSGTSAYMSPETLASTHTHGKPSDFWMIGIYFHELLLATRPWIKCPAHAVGYVEACQSDFNFQAALPRSLRFAALVDPDIEISAHVSNSAIEVLQGFLDIRPWERFSSDRFNDIKRLRFFRMFDWEVREILRYAIVRVLTP
jgi:serine/threonine protein kinase